LNSQPGGVIVVYGMTLGPKMPFLIQEMVNFVKQHVIHPVVSRVLNTDLDDLTGIDGLFDDMKRGKQFGKLVIEFGKASESKL
jgi:D-arabinose 1-dehydrogenase-like Zn-dependent alcohol dehydrogenase